MTAVAKGPRGWGKGPSVLLVLLWALSTDLTAQGIDTTDYFPLEVGNTYTYYQSLPCPPDTVRQRIGPWGGNRVRDTIIIDGKKYFITVVAGLEIGSDTVRIHSAGNMLIRRQGIEDVFYKFHAAVGDTWSYVIRVAGREYRYRATLQSRGDTVKVHAGTFKDCLRIFFDVPGIVGDEFTDWLAPNVGLVFRCVQEPQELYEATLSGIHYPVTSVEREPNPIVSFTLYQNYPNPFNPETIIKYELQTQGKVKLKVLDILGKVVIELVDDTLPPGSYEVKWNGKDGNGRSVVSGTYLYQLTVNKHQIAKKLLLTR